MTNIHDILATLSEAKSAMEAQPQLERQIRELETKLGNRERHNGDLEITILELRDELSALHTKLAGVEAARDEAMFRELEAEDKAEKALSVVRKVLSEASEYVEAITPVPVIEPEQPQVSAMEHTDNILDNPEVQASMVSVVEPLAERPWVPSSESEAPVSTDPATEAPISTELAKPYAGWGYWSKPNDLSWVDFVAGGGEQAPWNR